MRTVPLTILVLILTPTILFAADQQCYQERSCRVYDTDNTQDPPRRVQLRCIRVLMSTFSTSIFQEKKDMCHCVQSDIELSVPEGATLIDDYGLLYPDGSGRKLLCKGNSTSSAGPTPAPPGGGTPIAPPIDPPGNGGGTSDFNGDSFV